MRAARGLVNVRLLNRFSPGAILRTALIALSCINLVGLAALLAGAPMWTLIAHVVAAQACFGCVMGNAIALGQAEARHRAGAGSAVLGLLQFLLEGSPARCPDSAATAPRCPWRCGC